MDINSRMRMACTALAVAISLFAVCPHVSAQALTDSQNNLAHLEKNPNVANAATRYIQQGMELEKRGQWAEALNLYQKGIKNYPTNSALGKRRTLARIHYDLDRRYSDSSFLRSLNTTNSGTALNVYAEVLLKIHSYYVDKPQWVELASYGLTNLEIALRAPKFLKANAPNATPEQVQAAIQRTRAKLNNYPVRNRHDAYLVASTVAKSMNTDLGIPIQSTMFEFTNGAIAALDPYSAFMSDSQYGETMSQIEGNFVGLGVELRTHPEHLEIVDVIPGGPAAVSKIRAGDQIVAVDNKQVKSVGSERAADMLRGVAGSYVAVSVVRKEMKPQTIRLERRRVEIPSVDGVEIVDPANGVGYIRLTNFQKTTARDFDAALWKLHQQGMKSLIVDVRGNPGGLLSASVEVADRFVNRGVIVSTRGRNPLEDYTHKAQGPSTWLVPLVVLVDENSASASEIFAAAIRDHKRGTIVGRQSYGKGSVQGIFPLNVAGGGVRLTTAKFFSPLGKPISQVGVKPDYSVQAAAKASENGDSEIRRTMA